MDIATIVQSVMSILGIDASIISLVIMVITCLVTLASIVINYTNTPTAPTWWVVVYKVLEAIAMVNNKAKQRPELEAAALQALQVGYAVKDGKATVNDVVHAIENIVTTCK